MSLMSLMGHKPILLKEAIEGLKIREGKKYIDATVGGGGHAWKIIKRGGVILGIDRDPIVISNLKAQSSKLQLKTQNLKLTCGNFGRLEEIAKKNSFSKVSGVLFDLGLSSWQIEKSGRGFSYLRDEPLDMRLSPQEQTITAADILNQAMKEELYEIFSKYAEEERALPIVSALVRARPIETTDQLSSVIERVGGNIRTKARIFQALRIAVNNELENLKMALPQAVNLLEPGGRLAVISFHSLEDRIVKLTIRNYPPTPRLRRTGEIAILRNLTKKPIRPKLEEIKENPRARSAKLRIAEKREGS